MSDINESRLKVAISEETTKNKIVKLYIISALIEGHIKSNYHQLSNNNMSLIIKALYKNVNEKSTTNYF